MYIAVDIGGTNTRVASFKSFDPETLIGFRKLKTEEDYKKGLQNITNIIDDLIDDEKIDAIGISIASTINTDDKTVITPNIPEWRAENLVSDLKSEYKDSIKIINDGAAGGIAEALFGSGKDLESFTFLSWGTGLGGVTVEKSNSQLVIHEYEPGHLSIEGYGRTCECGKTDCIESYVGGRSVEKSLNKKIPAMNEKEWNEILEYMEKGLLKILGKYPVQNLVLGGKIFIEHPDFIKKLETDINKDLGNNIDFSKSSIGDKAPLYGALTALNKDLNIKFLKEF